jgi:GAF domain-containing protein
VIAGSAPVREQPPVSPDRPAVPPYEAFDDLAGLIVSDHSLDSVMTAISVVGKRLLPDVTEVSVTLLRGGQAETVASTGTLAVQMDERQYARGDGPCLTAAKQGELVLLQDAASTEQWPEYAALAREHGVGSSLSVPVKMPEPVNAGLNLYSDRQDGFPEHDVELARTLVAYAAVALTNIHLFESQKRVAEHLERALESRGVIDQAKGIVIAERRCSPDEAFQVLVELSQRTNRKLRDVAEALVNTTATG